MKSQKVDQILFKQQFQWKQKKILKVWKWLFIAIERLKEKKTSVRRRGVVEKLGWNMAKKNPRPKFPRVFEARMTPWKGKEEVITSQEAPVFAFSLSLPFRFWIPYTSVDVFLVAIFFWAISFGRRLLMIALCEKMCLWIFFFVVAERKMFAANFFYRFWWLFFGTAEGGTKNGGAIVFWAKGDKLWGYPDGRDEEETSKYELAKDIWVKVKIKYGSKKW